MDRIFYPDNRKWMSAETDLGKMMRELKTMVRFRKETLHIVDPTEGYENVGGDFSQGCSNPPHVNVKDEVLHPDDDNAKKQNEMEIEVEAEHLMAEQEMNQKDKWRKDDAICEGAVAAVGGADFFDLTEKSEKKKGRKRKDEKEGKMNVQTASAAGSSVAPDVSEPVTPVQALKTEVNESFNSTRNESANATTSTAFETFNYSDIKQEGPEINEDLKFFDLNLLLPDGFSQLDVEDDPYDFDNENENFANAAERYEIYKEHRQDLLHSDSEESEIVNSDFEEENVEETPIKISRGDAPPPPPAPTVHLKDSKRVTLTSIKGKNERMSNTSGRDEPTPGSSKNAKLCTDVMPFTEQSEPKPEDRKGPLSASDFKRFTDWVFEQSSARNVKNRNSIKPGLMKKLKIREADASNLQEETCVNQAQVHGEVFQDEPVMKGTSMPLLAPPIMPPASTNLQSLAVFITHGDDPSCFPWKSMNVQQQMNDDFLNEQYIKRMEQQKKDVANPSMKEQLVDKADDFMLNILVYQATDPNDVLPDDVKLYSEPRLAYEVQMLGSQTVQDLMNAVHCENDYIYMKEVSHPESFVEEPNEYAKAKFQSSVIVIHETMYMDPNHTEADYAKVINDWTKREPKKLIREFKTGDWNTKLNQLTLRFGCPYVYIHLGGCEHIFVFTQARLLHLEDNHLKRDYPKINGLTRFKNVYCRVDNEYLARWAVLDFKEFPENPMLLCTECVMMYCYDKQKKRRGNFRLYPFTQMANMI